ncbi:PEP-CTERM sorting domain-containing protein [Piscinibacter koreensis]|uniref:PEP-CTERM sorting domain-containing protein n=1 Tax=Piscinibacter koreensis TaxID=2742824 RepID=A0A7Y6TVS1_9BURK|nr:PEP-CTERM sorting domain-containing protein [Schlegelella koreensis]NUZ05330.1 PEP-CTERM sorting domain-containing protein [Schlegelella koreensis]
MSTLLRTLVLGATVAASFESAAIVVEIDRFTISRDGVVVFDDTFNDGAAPPSAPNFSTGAPLTYNVQGTLPAGSESGGRLRLNTDLGMPTANAVGLPRRIVGALLPTDIAAGGTQLGLGNVLSESGLFGLVVPTGPMFSTYGIRFTDAAAAGAQQFVQLGVRYNDVAGRPEVYYILQDFVANTVTTLGASLLAPPVGADQIQLTLDRRSTSNGDVFGSWSFLSAGANIGGGSFATPGTVFAGESFVRGQFFAAEDVTTAAIPEPAGAALLLSALGAAGLSARRRRR